MNTLLVGSNKTFDIDFSSPFLLIDDGSVIDLIEFPKRTKHTLFDPAKHHLDPLAGMNYPRACEFQSIISALYPAGENTLRKDDSEFLILETLCRDKPKTLAGMIQPDPKDPAKQAAHQKIERLLLSPTLRSIFSEATNFSLDHTVLARINPRELPEFDAKALAYFLISQFKGQVIITDFGFYGQNFLTYVIRQNRLTAGLRYLDEVDPDLKKALLTIPRKRACAALYDDAVVLALHAGEVRGLDGFDTAIKKAMGLIPDFSTDG